MGVLVKNNRGYSRSHESVVQKQKGPCGPFVMTLRDYCFLRLSSLSSGDFSPANGLRRRNADG